MPSQPSVLLVGCGRMGRALLTGWRAQMSETEIRVIEPGEISEPLVSYRKVDEVPADFAPGLVVFAVKPQQLDALLPDYARFRQATFLSIAAGKPMARLAAGLGEVALVRAMPNTPAAIGRGMSVCVANARVTAEGRALAAAALRAVGQVAWVEDEGLMDAVTALSGSGPAYVFYLVEILAEAGARLGLPVELAMQLARQTVVGSGALLEQSGETAAALRAAVTSPGGTTAAALVVLQDGRLAAVFAEALAAAEARGRELAAS